MNYHLNQKITSNYHLYILAPFRQSNSCKNLNALTQFQKLHKYPHLKKKKKLKKKGVAAATP
jgi:hypothetical protein